MSRRVKAARGVTLIELVVAITILSIGALAAFRAFDQAMRGLGGQEARLIAHQVALNRAAELQLLGVSVGRNLPLTVPMGRVDWQVEIHEAATRIGLVEVEIRVSTPMQPGARLVVHAPGDRGG